MTKKLAFFTMAMIVLSFATTAEATVRGNTYDGTVRLMTPGGSVVPFPWCLRFNTDHTIRLNAAGISQDGEYRETINFGIITFYTAAVSNSFESKFTGISLFSAINIVTSFTDNDGNTLAPPAILLISNCDPQ